LDPPAAGEEMICAPYISRICRRSVEVFSGMTQIIRYPRRCAIMAREIPVFPEVGSRMVAPRASTPSFSACSTMKKAARSLTDPVGFRSSSLAHSRTSGAGDSRGSPTSGVPPSESSSES